MVTLILLIYSYPEIASKFTKLPSLFLGLILIIHIIHIFGTLRFEPVNPFLKVWYFFLEIENHCVLLIETVNIRPGLKRVNLCFYVYEICTFKCWISKIYTCSFLTVLFVKPVVNQKDNLFVLQPPCLLHRVHWSEFNSEFKAII